MTPNEEKIKTHHVDVACPGCGKPAKSRWPNISDHPMFFDCGYVGSCGSGWMVYINTLEPGRITLTVEGFEDRCTEEKGSLSH